MALEYPLSNHGTSTAIPYEQEEVFRRATGSLCDYDFVAPSKGVHGTTKI